MIVLYVESSSSLRYSVHDVLVIVREIVSSAADVGFKPLKGSYLAQTVAKTKNLSCRPALCSTRKGYTIYIACISMVSRNRRAYAAFRVSIN